MPFKLKFLLCSLLLGLGLAVDATESSINEAPAAQKPGEQEPQKSPSQSDKQGEGDSKPDSEADFPSFTPSEEILTDRPAAFPADI